MNRNIIDVINDIKKLSTNTTIDEINFTIENLDGIEGLTQVDICTFYNFLNKEFRLKNSISLNHEFNKIAVFIFNDDYNSIELIKSVILPYATEFNLACKLIGFNTYQLDYLLSAQTYSSGLIKSQLLIITTLIFLLRKHNISIDFSNCTNSK